VKVKAPGGKGAEAGAAELLAYMYDRSLDLFAPHHPPDLLAIYPSLTGVGGLRSNLGESGGLWLRGSSRSAPGYPTFTADQLRFPSGYGVGGPGRRLMKGGVASGMEAQSAPMNAPAAPMAMNKAKEIDALAVREDKAEKPDGEGVQGPPPAEPPVLRSDFSETAFWRPSLLTDRDGTATIEFTVPDSVTAWNVWVHAVTRDLKGGSLRRETRSVKDLMVRPYLPRFLREGDAAELKVVVNNASDLEMSGKVTLDVIDPATN